MSANLDIELLRTFHAILRFGRFLAAASHLNRSPSAVSTHVRRLEEPAGGRLFERDNQSVRLTPLGQRFQRQTAELLEPTTACSPGCADGKNHCGCASAFPRNTPASCSAASCRASARNCRAGAGGAHRRQRQAGRTPAARPAGPRLLVQAQDETPYDGLRGSAAPSRCGSPATACGSICNARCRWPCTARVVPIGRRCWKPSARRAGAGARWSAVPARRRWSNHRSGLAIGVIDRARVGPTMRDAGPAEGFAELPAPHSPGLRPGRAAAGAGAPPRTDRRGVPALSRYSAGR